MSLEALVRRAVTTPLKYARTLSHARAWQVGGRLFERFPKRSPKKAPAHLTLGPPPAFPFLEHDPWNRRAALVEGKFTFLNETRELGMPPSWDPVGAPLLWTFNLHYFQFLHLLDPRAQLEVCRSWIRACPPVQRPAWHPYPLSLRIGAWVRARLDDRQILESLYQQSSFLSKHLETHVYGNHLLENARALVLAGTFFERFGEAPSWRELGLSVITKELDEQLLSDGFHYELSPMYHVLMLALVLDVLAVIDPGEPRRASLERATREMGDALATVLHPDGSIPLFNDSTYEIAPPPRVVLDRLHTLTGHEARARESLPASGYHAIRDDGCFGVIDAGAPGPTHLLAHAHSDLFSFELSLYGQLVVVNTGVEEYRAGPSRTYVRSAAAHSSLSVDGLGHLETWSSFKVARAFSPRDVRVVRDGRRIRVEGWFDGFGDQLGENVAHRRVFELDLDAKRLAVDDWVTGSGVHEITSFVHLAPGIETRLEELVRGQTITMTSRSEAGSPAQGIARARILEGRARLERTPFHPRFGVREDRTTIVLSDRGPLPRRLRYEISWLDSRGSGLNLEAQKVLDEVACARPVDDVTARQRTENA
ncbi:MAG: alginate lyase family protein [Deltaproteobacteria bacterium]|nr:alginate lyase family protein [Deltaproteobacteria bacterium]